MSPDAVAICLTVALCGLLPLAGLAYFIYDTFNGKKIPSGTDKIG